MAIRWVVFDIGGILEIIPEGGDPTIRFPQMLANWEDRLGMPQGALGQRIHAMGERLMAEGKDGAIGTCTEAEWLEQLQLTTGWDQPQLDAFMGDFWDYYCGNPNPELTSYLASLRPRYSTALLSNSFVGARREEEARFRFSELVDHILYSHELGYEKPDPHIFALACERLSAQPEEIIFLDDVEANIAGAQAAGIHAVLFQNNAQAIADIEARLGEHTI
ncbi:MAG TPA: HAD family phosphatase [Ktedonobacterales bacterium]